jgi:hypothetical protein
VSDGRNDQPEAREQIFDGDVTVAKKKVAKKAAKKAPAAKKVAKKKTAKKKVAMKGKCCC